MTIAQGQTAANTSSIQARNVAKMNAAGGQIVVGTDGNMPLVGASERVGSRKV
jgi:hypothetical protein